MTKTGADSAIQDSACHAPLPSRADSKPNTVSTVISEGMPHRDKKGLRFILGTPPFAAPTRDIAR
jgi:hypothetical protein